MGIYSLAFAGLFPFGSLLAGFLADEFGISGALRINAAILLLFAIPAFLFLRKLPRLSQTPEAAVEQLLDSESAVIRAEQISKG
jgi:MFS family permease